MRMTYYPQKQLVEARAVPTSTCANGLCPRGDYSHFHMPATQSATSTASISDNYRMPVVASVCARTRRPVYGLNAIECCWPK